MRTGGSPGSPARPAPWRTMPTPGDRLGGLHQQAAHVRAGPGPGRSMRSAQRQRRHLARRRRWCRSGCVGERSPFGPRPGPGRRAVHGRAPPGRASGARRPSGPREENEATAGAAGPTGRDAMRAVSPGCGGQDLRQRRALAGAEPDHRDRPVRVARDGREARRCRPRPTRQADGARRRRRCAALSARARRRGPRRRCAPCTRLAPVGVDGSPSGRPRRPAPSAPSSSTTGASAPAGLGAHQGQRPEARPPAGPTTTSRSAVRGRGRPGHARPRRAPSAPRPARRPAGPGEASARRCRSATTTVAPTRSAASSALATRVHAAAVEAAAPGPAGSRRRGRPCRRRRSGRRPARAPPARGRCGPAGACARRPAPAATTR